MKTIKIFIILSIYSIALFGQCDLELQEQIEKDIKKNNATFLKSFSADIKPGENTAKYSMVLSEKTLYRFYIYESDKYDGKGHFELYEDSILLASNMNKQNGKRYNSLDFKCNKQKAYHLIIYKDEGNRYCAEVVLAYIDKIKEDESSQFYKDSILNEMVYFIVDEMPVFSENDRDCNDFRLWIQANLAYPQEAINQKIKGRVFVQFVVSNKGEVKNIKIVRGLHPLLDQATIELMKKCPKWQKPGYKDGKAVNVAFTFPVVFELKN